MIIRSLIDRLTRPIEGPGKVFAIVFLVIFAGSMVLLFYLNSPVRELSAAAARGDVGSQYILGQKYFYGCDNCGVRQDYVRAIYWLRRAAEQGSSNAENRLGVSYLFGQGVEQNYDQAVYWLRRAAERGNSQAEFNLGVSYRLGQGVEQNYDQAAYWYRRAAAQGHEGAQENLDLMYRRGLID